MVAWWRGGVVAWWRGGVVAWWRSHGQVPQPGTEGAAPSPRLFTSPSHATPQNRLNTVYLVTRRYARYARYVRYAATPLRSCAVHKN